MSFHDLYKILGVGRDADAAAIKAAYRRKVKTAHPDAGGDPEDFRLLTLAYEVLSDEEKRHHYDSTGEIPGDDSPEAAEQAKLYSAVSEMLLKVVGQITMPQYEDVLAFLRKMVAQHLRELDESIAGMQQLVVKIPVIANRIQVREGENILRSLLLARHEELQKKIDAVRAERNRYESILEFLDQYDYYTRVENVLVSTDISGA